MAGCVSPFLLDYPKLYGSLVTPPKYHLTAQTPNWCFTEHLTKNKMEKMGDASGSEIWVLEQMAWIPCMCVQKQIQWRWGGEERTGQRQWSGSQGLDEASAGKMGAAGGVCGVALLGVVVGDPTQKQGWRRGHVVTREEGEEGGERAAASILTSSCLWRPTGKSGVASPSSAMSHPVTKSSWYPLYWRTDVCPCFFTSGCNQQYNGFSTALSNFFFFDLVCSFKWPLVLMIMK